jgi:hypothetical protein
MCIPTHRQESYSCNSSIRQSPYAGMTELDRKPSIYKMCHIDFLTQAPRYAPLLIRKTIMFVERCKIMLQGLPNLHFIKIESAPILSLMSL